MSAANAIKSIHIEYFAYLRERRGLTRETVGTAALTASELFAELAERHGFGIEPSRVRVAVNDRVVAWDDVIRDGDRVVFLTPFGGG